MIDNSLKLGVHGYTFIYRGMLDLLVPISIDKYVSKGDYVLDIGANFGLWSFKMSEIIGADGRVFAYEPFPKNIRFFKKNILLNNSNNIVLNEYALGDSNTCLTIHEGVDLGSTSLLKTNDRKFSSESEVVNIRILDEFTFDKRITFVKLDVEGFEMFVLKGMQNFIVQNRPIIAIEINREQLLASGYTPDDIIDFFNPYKYKIYKLSGNREVEIQSFEEDNDYLLKPIL
jgi:FkbM family methyltransferase